MTAKGSIWSWSVSNYLAVPGEKVIITATIQNVGDAFAWFYPRCADPTPYVEVVAESPIPYYIGLNPGARGEFKFSFIMPGTSMMFYIEAMRWSGSAYVVDDRVGPIPINVLVGVPKAKIWQMVSAIPTQANPGAIIDIQLHVMNVGDATGLLQPWVRNSNVGFVGYYPDPFQFNVDPNNTALFKMKFTMPNNDVSFMLVACHYDWSIGWVVDEYYNTYTVKLSVIETKVENLDCVYDGIYGAG